MKVVVLGAGLMGSAAAYDLANSNGVEGVILADANGKLAEEMACKIGSEKIMPESIDASNTAEVWALFGGADVVLSAVPYFLNAGLAKAAVKTGAHFCDMGGNNDVVKQELALDSEAKDRGVTVVPDCGLAPGLVNILAMHAYSQVEDATEIHMRVGGLPVEPEPPLNYQLVFSVYGLINEYAEKSRIIREGEPVEVDSLADLETLEFPEPFGTLEAFNTSGGSSTLVDTLRGRVKTLDYKTLRYPGHCEKLKAIFDLGMASKEPRDIRGQRVVPRDVLANMLLETLPSSGKDATLLRVDVKGKDGSEKRYQMIDYADENTGHSAMMRTTAYPTSIIAQMLGAGEMIRGPGAFTPEVGVSAEKLMNALKERGVLITES